MLTQRAGQLEAVAFAMLFILLLHFARGGLMGFVRALDAAAASQRAAADAARLAPVEPLPRRTLPRARHADPVGEGRGQALRRPGRGERRELRRRAPARSSA